MAEEEEVKLLGVWASPFSRRIELALKLKGIQYQYIEEDLSNKSLLLLKSNPIHKKIPVLIHNGKPIAESFLVLEYIDDTWPKKPIMPKDPYDRAMARFWAKFIDEKIFETARRMITGKEEEKEQIIEEYVEQLKVLEKELGEKDYFGGESIGYLDIVAIIIAHWLQVRQEVLQIGWFTEEKFPFLYKWIVKLLENHMVNECLPPRDKLFAYLKGLTEAAKIASNK